ncbi:MAG: hypothetical protein H0W04_02760 [Chthoniobacterales bacterium]|nr:hypothetical protein [Chthoniobacterales bacterium]
MDHSGIRAVVSKSGEPLGEYFRSQRALVDDELQRDSNGTSRIKPRQLKATEFGRLRSEIELARSWL